MNGDWGDRKQLGPTRSESLQTLCCLRPGLECYLEDLTKDTTVDGGTPSLEINLFYPAILPFASDDLVGFELIYFRGYYTNSLDARPLVGPHGGSNAYVCGGMGTYGLMGSPAAGHH